MLRADLHIHTVLSPCGDLEMSPLSILEAACKQKLDIIGITDHNSSRQSKIIRDAAKAFGIFVLTGAEVTTQEEAHCLAFFADDARLDVFQKYLDKHLPDFPNNPEKFGYQVVVDTQDQILYEEKKLLISALDQSLEEVEKYVHSLEGIFIPAHIDKSRFSILSQLGFVPPDLSCEALELSPHCDPAIFFQTHPELTSYAFTQSSDAHYIPDIGKSFTLLDLDVASFSAVRHAIQHLKRDRI